MRVCIDKVKAFLHFLCLSNTSGYSSGCAFL